MSNEFNENEVDINEVENNEIENNEDVVSQDSVKREPVSLTKYYVIDIVGLIIALVFGPGPFFILPVWLVGMVMVWVGIIKMFQHGPSVFRRKKKDPEDDK